MGVLPRCSRADVAKARTESRFVRSSGIDSPTDVGRRAPRTSRASPDRVSRSAAMAPKPDVPPVITIVDMLSPPSAAAGAALPGTASLPVR
jgi:hypothetical protein